MSLPCEEEGVCTDPEIVGYHYYAENDDVNYNERIFGSEKEAEEKICQIVESLYHKHDITTDTILYRKEVYDCGHTRIDEDYAICYNFNEDTGKGGEA